MLPYSRTRSEPEVPTKAECLDAFAEVLLRAAIRIEQDRLKRRLAEQAEAADKD